MVCRGRRKFVNVVGNPYQKSEFGESQVTFGDDVGPKGPYRDTALARNVLSTTATK